MSVVTVVETLTDTVIVTPTASLYDSSTTTASYFVTLAATAGESLTIFPPAPIPSPLSTAWYSPTVTPTNIYTVTEVDVFLQVPAGGTWSTVTLDATGSPGTTPGASPGQVLVIPGVRSGWDGWSEAAKAGLIVGVVLATLMLLCLCCVLHRRRAMWYTHEMPNWYGFGPMAGPMAGPKPPVVLRGGGADEAGCGHRFGFGTRRRRAEWYRRDVSETELKNRVSMAIGEQTAAIDGVHPATATEGADKSRVKEQERLMPASNDRGESNAQRSTEEIHPAV